MIAHAKAEPVLASHLRPDSDDILLRADVDRVPRVVPGIVTVKIVVMVSKRHKIFRTGALVEIHKLFRVPVFGFPQMIDLHEAGF